MLTFRDAKKSDCETYFRWVNDALVRKNSLNTETIPFEDHKKWFDEKINNPDVIMYVFSNEEKDLVGQVIIELKDGWVSVGQSVAKEHRGKRYSSEILTKSTNAFLEKYPSYTIVSVVRSANIASLKMSVNSGFNVLQDESVKGKVLVLKGHKQNDRDYITEAKKYYNLI